MMMSTMRRPLVTPKLARFYSDHQSPRPSPLSGSVPSPVSSLPSDEQEQVVPSHATINGSPSLASLNATPEPDWLTPHHQRLVASGFDPVTAHLLLQHVNRICEAKTKEILDYYLTNQEYEAIQKVYHVGVEKFQLESMNVQKSSFESIKNNYANLASSIQTVNDSTMEEIKGFESGLQLDINLDKKKSSEALKSVNETSKQAQDYLKSKLSEVEKDLDAVDRHAKRAILGKNQSSDEWTPPPWIVDHSTRRHAYEEGHPHPTETILTLF